MRRDQLLLLARAIGSYRHHFPYDAFLQLLSDVGEVCAQANPAFDSIRFREAAFRAPLKKGESAAVAIDPLAFRSSQDEGENR